MAGSLAATPPLGVHFWGTIRECFKIWVLPRRCSPPRQYCSTQKAGFHWKLDGKPSWRSSCRGFLSTNHFSGGLLLKFIAWRCHKETPIKATLKERQTHIIFLVGCLQRETHQPQMTKGLSGRVQTIPCWGSQSLNGRSTETRRDLKSDAVQQGLESMKRNLKVQSTWVACQQGYKPQTTGATPLRGTTM